MQLLSSAELRESEVGGKAVCLSESVRAGLPVPPGIALSVEFVERVVRGDAAALDAVMDTFVKSGKAYAVRSSAIGEDSATASFAGQHLTVLHVRTRTEFESAIRAVWNSAHTEAALAYRKKMGIDAPIRIAVVVQELVEADSAGVLFTRNPMTGADEIVIEAAFGLGEVVVAGLVTPDQFRLAYDGRLLETRLGFKDLAIRSSHTGGTREVELDEETATALSLTEPQLRALHALALRCVALYGNALDLEWAFAQERVYLLQRRAITQSKRA